MRTVLMRSCYSPSFSSPTSRMWSLEGRAKADATVVVTGAVVRVTACRAVENVLTSRP